jgi:hypothetical protein
MGGVWGRGDREDVEKEERREEAGDGLGWKRVHGVLCMKGGGGVREQQYVQYYAHTIHLCCMWALDFDASRQ